jgi:hypothetical protein
LHSDESRPFISLIAHATHLDQAENDGTQYGQCGCNIRDRRKIHQGNLAKSAI